MNKISDEIFNRIIIYVELGDSIRRALRRVKINPQTFYNNITNIQKIELDYARISSKKFSNSVNSRIGTSTTYKDCIFGFETISE